MTVTTDRETIAIDVTRTTGAISPKLAELFYKHGDGTPNDDRHHTLVVEVTGMTSGQFVILQLDFIEELKGQPDHDEVRHGLFGEGTGSGRSTNHRWMIPADQPTMECGLAWRPHRMNTTNGELHVSYSATLMQGDATLATLDPDIRVIPDP